MARRKTYPYHDWSPIDKAVLSEFDDELCELTCQRFGVDADGDCPVRVRILDRTRHQPMHWRPVPYEHEAKTPAEVAKVEEALLANLATALEALTRFRQIRKHMDRAKSEKDAET